MPCFVLTHVTIHTQLTALHDPVYDVNALPWYLTSLSPKAQIEGIHEVEQHMVSWTVVLNTSSYTQGDTVFGSRTVVHCRARSTTVDL